MRPYRLPSVLALAFALSLTALAAEAPAASSTLWEFDAGGKIIGKPTAADGTLLLAAGQAVYALDLDGNELWRRDVGAEVAAQVRVDDGTIYVHSSAGLHALDRQGEPLWTHEAEDLGPLVDGRTWGWGPEVFPDPWGWYRSAPLLTADAVIFGSSAGVHAVDQATGEALWQVPIGPVTADPVAHEDLIVVACWNHSVYGLEAETGKVRWRFRAQVPPTKGTDWIGYQGFHVTPIVAGDRVFVGNRNTYFYALDADDGTVAWSSKVGASWIGSPAVATEEHIYYGLSDGMAVLGFRRDSGKQTLFFKTGSLVFAQPQVHRDRLIVGTLSGRLYSIDPATDRGELLLHFGSEEKPYPEFFDRKIVPEDLSRHQATAWSIEKMLTESSSVLNLSVEGDTAYVGTGSGVLYAVDLGSVDLRSAD